MRRTRHLTEPVSRCRSEPPASSDGGQVLRRTNRTTTMNQLAQRICAMAAVAYVLYATGLSYAFPPGTGLSPEDVSAIRSTSERYVEAMRENDWAEVARFITADAVRMPPNQPMHQGREAIEQWFSQVAQVSEYSITLEDIQGAAGFAYVRARYTIKLTPRGMSRAISDTGKAIEIWRKDSDGVWRMASAIWNSDIPAPDGGP